eukprot:3274054-Amphidinium_carterae.1
MSEQQWRIESARSELEQARLDAAGISASAQSGHSCEAVEGLRNMEAAVDKRFVLSEEEIAKRHGDGLRRVEAEQQFRLCEALHGMEIEKDQIKHSSELAHVDSLQSINLDSETLFMERRKGSAQAKRGDGTCESCAGMPCCFCGLGTNPVLAPARRCAEGDLRRDEHSRDATAASLAHSPDATAASLAHAPNLPNVSALQAPSQPFSSAPAMHAMMTPALHQMPAPAGV